MTKQPGHLWDLIQEWLDAFKYGKPSQAELARETGVSESSLSDYKYGTHMPPPHFVVLLAQEIRVPYETVLDAVLQDHGYRGDSLRRVREEIETNGTPIASRRTGRPNAREREAERLGREHGRQARGPSPKGETSDEGGESA